MESLIYTLGTSELRLLCYYLDANFYISETLQSYQIGVSFFRKYMILWFVLRFYEHVYMGVIQI